jgi:UDP-glucose 6-dehydrogenase
MGGVFAESDMDSLVELAQSHGVPLKVLSAARDVNAYLADRLVDKISLVLNSVENKEVGILGLSSRTRIQWQDRRRYGWRKIWFPKARTCGLTIR